MLAKRTTSLPMLRGLATTYLGARSLLHTMRQPGSRVQEPQNDGWPLFHERAEAALDFFLRIQEGSRVVDHAYTSSRHHANVAVALIGATPDQVQRWSQQLVVADSSLMAGLNQSVYESAKTLSELIEVYPDEIQILAPANSHWLREGMALSVGKLVTVAAEENI